MTKNDSKGFPMPEDMLGEDGCYLDRAVQMLIIEHNLFAVLDATVLFCERARAQKLETLGDARTWGRIKRKLVALIEEEKDLYLAD